MNILISGASGLIGQALSRALSSAGHSVYPLSRLSEKKREPDSPFYWKPDEGFVHLEESIRLDVVINLAGENIADGRWTKKKKSKIIQSRVRGTQCLCEAIAALNHKPELLISGSAIGFYGETGERVVSEESEAGTGFLSDIAQKWEAATQSVEKAGVRTVHIRTGIVLSPSGGVLQKMMLPIKMGVGGVVGNGKQYMSWVSINDMVAMLQFIMENDNITGPVNMVSRHPVTNYTFTKLLGKVLKRPTLFPLPAFVARLMFGEMADALLLSSTRVSPDKLVAAGYPYIHEDLESALVDLLKK